MLRSAIALTSSTLVCAGVAGAQTPEWTSIGPEGGTIRAFATVASTIYAALEPATIYRSSDGGRSWSRMGSIEPVDDSTFGQLLVDDVDAGTLYASLDHRLFRSIDGGASWHPLEVR